MSKVVSYREGVREALIEKMQEDENVIFLGEDIGIYGGAFGVSKGLLEKFGSQRIIETPISENSFVGVAVGAAMTGFKPVVEIMFMDFITTAADQIINHAAKINYMYGGQLHVPLTIRTPAGGGRGYGASHSQSLESLFLNIPGLKIIAPADPYTAKGLLKAAIDDPNPVLFVENKMLYDFKQEIPKENFSMEIGQARKVLQGEDVTLISYGRGLHLAMEAAQVCHQKGVSAEVIDLMTLKPMDRKTITESVQKTGRAVIIEEGHKTGGVGAEVAAIIMEEALEYLNGRVTRVAAEDFPIPSATHLEKMVFPDIHKVMDAIDKSFF